MGETFGKREKENQKKKEKEQQKAEGKTNAKPGSLKHMMADVDESGNISSKPPDPNTKNVLDVLNEDNIINEPGNIGGPEANQTRKGRVSYFSISKGYGFIKDAQTQESLFVHANALTTPVNESDFVSFQIGRGVKGPIAIDVRKI